MQIKIAQDTPQKRLRVAVIGSCVSRDPFSAHPEFPAEIVHYEARQSFAGLGCTGLAYEPDWYDALPPFEKRCAFSDLSKSERFLTFERNCDVLIIDCIDERFDLLRIGETYVSATKHIQSPAFLQRYRNDITRLQRFHPGVTALWQAGAQIFFERVLRHLRPEQIILHEALWAENSLFPDGTKIPFGAPYAALAPRHNELLETYFRITKELVPGIKTWRAPSDVLFADPHHRWSKEPFHYVPKYYDAFMQYLDAGT
jgi:hypothetical protein